VRRTIRTLHYSSRTEKAYVCWARRVALHYGPARRPADLGADEARCFLSHLAVNERVGASTQNQASAPRRSNTHVFYVGKRRVRCPADLL
jgi:hypothetical protein